MPKRGGMSGGSSFVLVDQTAEPIVAHDPAGRPRDLAAGRRGHRSARLGRARGVVVVGVSPAGTRISVDPGMLLQQRVLTGSSFGAGHQRTDVPMLIDLYMSGKYKLDEIISRRLPLTELNHAFDLMVRGEVKRSVIVYE